MKYLTVRNSIIVGLILLSLLVLIGYTSPNETIHRLLDRYTRVFNLISSISVTIGVVGILITYLSREDTVKNNQYNVVNGLMLRYSDLLPKLLEIEEGTIQEDRTRKLILLQYYNLSEEQLNYIGKGLIPQGIDEIWINGIKEQIKTFHDFEEVEVDNDGNVIDDFIGDYIDELKYPLLNILWNSYLENNEILNSDIKNLIILKVNER